MQKFTGTQYLMIDIANAFGLDDRTWNERLDWFNQNRDKLGTLTKQAKEPAQFMAGVLAWEDTMMGIPTGYMCGLDATASGIQLLSIMSGCLNSAANCNLVNTGRREDAYTNTHEHMANTLNKSFSFKRKDTKDALMTHMYASKAVPKRVFGESPELLDQFYSTVDVLMPGANELNKALLKLWNPKALDHSWVMPDGFDVKIKVTNMVTHEVTFFGNTYQVAEEVNMPKDFSLSLPANIVHSIDGFVVREMARRCSGNYDKAAFHAVLNSTSGDCSVDNYDDYALLHLLSLYEASGFMSAVILNHLNVDNVMHLDANAQAAVKSLIDSLPEKRFDLVSIHDCFRFHANYGNDVRQQYVNILAELADSEITASIATNLLGEKVIVPKRAPNLSQFIRKSEYALS